MEAPLPNEKYSVTSKGLEAVAILCNTQTVNCIATSYMVRTESRLK